MEAWLSGPLDGIDPILMPAAHALVQAREDISVSVSNLSTRELSLRPGGIASVGFHLRHVAGSIDRLLTYARGELLGDRQRQVLDLEIAGAAVPVDAKELTTVVHAAIDAALRVICATDVATLQERRTVGRAALPTTVFGLLFHIAEHTQRHTGQIITTAKVVKAGRETGEVMSDVTERMSPSPAGNPRNRDEA